MTLNGGLFNCRAGRNPRLVKAAVQQIIDDHPDLQFLLLQEAQAYVVLLSLIPGWRVIMHDECGTAVMVRNDVEAKFAHTYRLGFLRWPFSLGGRPVRWHPRRALVSVVIGGWLRVASIHMVPAPENSMAREIAYDTGCRRLIRWARAHERRPLVIGGDWNKPARRTGANTPSWVAKTIGADVRFIAGHVDYVLARKCTVSNLRALPEGGSDHELILFTVHRTPKESA